jgi:dephospho-CoA kinase
MAFVVALTGGIGCGKTCAANFFAQLGARVVDTDEIAHRLTRAGSPALSQIGAQLGAEYFLDDGTLDRARLRQKVFTDALARKELEAILHPLIHQEALAEIAAARAPYVVLVVPLLFETGAYASIAQRTLVVDCSEKEQIQRVQARSGMSAEEARSIIAAQAPRAFRLARADDVLVNDGSPQLLETRVRELHAKYLRLAEQHANSG